MIRPMTMARKNVLTMKKGPPFRNSSLSQLIDQLPPDRATMVVAIAARTRQANGTRITLGERELRSVVLGAHFDPAPDRAALLGAQQLPAGVMRREDGVRRWITRRW